MNGNRELSQVARQIRSMVAGEVWEHEPMSRHTSYRIGGPADVLVRPATLDASLYLFDWLTRENVPWIVLGHGTNLLVMDEGIRGVVVDLTRATRAWDWSGSKVHVGGGAPLAGLARRAALMGLSGLEFAAGIPGTLGGAIVMNAGAEGGCMADVTVSVDLWVPGEGLQVVPASELSLGYRTSILQSQPGVVLGASLALRVGEPGKIQRKMDEILEKRRRTQPLNYPNAGSVFRNPPGDAAGRLLEAVHMKGMRVGDAQVSTVHANFIVNLGRARARDVLALMQVGRKRVWESFGVWLEPEIKLVGGNQLPMPAKERISRER